MGNLACFDVSMGMQARSAVCVNQASAAVIRVHTYTLYWTFLLLKCRSCCICEKQFTDNITTSILYHGVSLSITFFKIMFDRTAKKLIIVKNVLSYCRY